MLARLMAQSVEQWIENSSRLCGRLAADRFSAANAFRPARVSSCCCEAGDSRIGTSRYGQSVTESLTFADGQQLMYKPRSVRPEMVFNSVLGWINRRGVSLQTQNGPEHLDRSSYGWMEFMSRTASASTRARSPDLLRASRGASGGVARAWSVRHSLRKSDRMWRTPGRGGSRDAAGRNRTGSVLGTGVLPRNLDGQESDLDASALGAAQVQDAGLRFPMWRHSNTDQMTLVEGAPRETEQHRVRLNGKLGVAADYVRELKAGFRNAYGCLLEHRKQLQSHPMMKRFDRLELRILLRDSATYGRMHLHLLYPEYLEDGIDRSIELEWLARPLCIRSKLSPGRVAVYEQERAAMERLDLPLFTTKTWRAMRHDPTTLEAKAFPLGRGSKGVETTAGAAQRS